MEPDTFHHYTFDFSQCVSLPHYSRQMSPIFFLSLRKVHIFGFRISAGKQLNFLIDEAEAMGKDGKETHGPNAVLSMIDYALESHCVPVETFTIHADNCPGQNKNMYVIGYFLWRVMTGQQTGIELLMQIPGHARCHVDSGFATLKKAYIRHDTETLDELAGVVDRSSVTNVSVRYPQWIWRDWKSFLSRHFKSFVGIRKYQHFRFTASLPGIVIVKEKRGGEETHVNLLKDRSFRFLVDTRSEPVQAAGLSLNRKEYLRRSVSKHVSEEKREQFCAGFAS
ncbi:uncharacterized protein LOC128235542 [Mya arenaria]|uniref:uncharacterized protein LOC128235542 n=1 Tax=Mya arenaria TaxID=6604 RepID=UPI0022E792EB|nr:uncharacterized protein LOC128235542 [Mya arenaria]